MSESDPKPPIRRPDVEHYCNTQNKFSKTSMDWTIHNFDLLLNLNSELTLKSPGFGSTACVFSTGTWHIKLVIKPVYMNETKIGLYFVRSNLLLKAEASLWVCIVHEDGEESNQRNFIGELTLLETGLDEFITKSLLVGSLMPKGNLTIRCIVTLLHLDTAEPISGTRYSDRKLTGFMKLLKGGDFSDAVLECGDRKFPVHKCVLSARSSTFRELFTQNTDDNILIIKDLEPDVLENLLSFIYSDTVQDPCSVAMATKLLEASEVYCLDELGDLCDECLEDSLTVHNLLEISATAHLYDLDVLKEFCIKFMFAHGSEVVFSDDSGEFFRNAPHFLLEGVLKDYFDEKSSFQGNNLTEPLKVQDDQSLTNFRFPPFSGTSLVDVKQQAIVKANQSLNSPPSNGSTGLIENSQVVTERHQDLYKFLFGLSNFQHQTTQESGPSVTSSLQGIPAAFNVSHSPQTIPPATISSFQGIHAAFNANQSETIKPATTSSLHGIPAAFNISQCSQSIPPATTSILQGIHAAFKASQSQTIKPATTSSLQGIPSAFNVSQCSQTIPPATTSSLQGIPAATANSYICQCPLTIPPATASSSGLVNVGQQTVGQSNQIGTHFPMQFPTENRPLLPVEQFAKTCREYLNFLGATYDK